MAAYVDLFFVNVLGLTYNIGATLFVLALIAACFWGIYYTYRKHKILLNTILLCITVIIIGYTSFAVVVIRSSVDTPTNENQPDNPFNLVRYLGREQYGSNPLVYGETFAAVLKDIKTPEYYNVHNGKYVKVSGPAVPVYSSDSKMLFPRMYTSGAGDSYVPFYEMYTEGKGSIYQMQTLGLEIPEEFKISAQYVLTKQFNDMDKTISNLNFFIKTLFNNNVVFRCFRISFLLCSATFSNQKRKKRRST